MMARVLIVVLLFAGVPVPIEGQTTTSPPIMQRTVANRSKQSTLLVALQRALQRDEVERAAQQIEELLDMGTAPVTIFDQMRAAVTPRGEALLQAVLRDRKSADTGLMQRELLLLMAVHRGDDAVTDSLMGDVDTAPIMSQPTLAVVAATARAAGKVPVAIWAYEQLRTHHEPTGHQIIVPLAECLVHESRINEATAMLQGFLETPGVPESYRDQARLLQARLVYRHEEKTSEALGLLEGITDRRAQTEARLLAAIIRFLESGNDSLTGSLETLARVRPDTKEANDAFELARLSPLLPTDNHEREAVLRALRLDIRERWGSAGAAYLSISPKLARPLSSYLGIRAARCLERAGEFEKALEVWNQVIHADEDAVIALLGKGDCQAAMGFADSARATYLTILKRHPENPQAARARSRLLD